MLRSMNLTRTALLRTCNTKPLCSLTQNLNKRFSRGLCLKCKTHSTLNTLNGVPCSTRFIHQNAHPNFSEETNTTRQPFRSQNAPSNELDKIIFDLDMDARRLGRLTREDVDNLLVKIKELGQVTSAQGLLIIRCCGTLMPEELRPERIKLANQVWAVLEEKNCFLDVSHYNVLLKVYLENEYQFSPIDFLSNMESKGIIANRVTYQRIIARFCADGDIEGASKILEFMKEKEIAVNEIVFNELIFGHAKINDINGAKDIIEVMKKAKLEPSSRTYFALARGYALHGNLAGVISTIEEAEKNQTFLSDKDYLNIIYTLAVNGHEDKVDDILNKPSKGIAYNQECINIILELVNEGKDQLAFKIFQTMPMVLGRDGTVASSGLFLIRQMVRAERPVELVLELCRKLEDSNFFKDSLSRATFYALAYKKPAHALVFIKEMAARGLPIRNHYFWPLFIEKSQEGEQAVYDVLHEMGELGCLPSNETLLDFVLPHINTLNPESVIQKFKDLNHSVDSIISQLTAFYLLQQEPDKAAELLDKHPVSLLPSLIIRALALAMKGPENIESILKILSRLIHNLDQDWCGQFLIHYATEKNFNSSTFKCVIEAMLERDLRISYSAAKHIQTLSDMSADIIPVLEKLASSDVKGSSNDSDLTSLTNVNPREMTAEELESHLFDLKSKGSSTRGVLKRLLFLYCKNQNVERVIEIKQELDRDQFVYSGGMYASLIDLFVSTKNLPEALKYLRLLESDKDFRLDTYKLVKLCTLMVEDGKSDEALQLLSQEKELDRPVDAKLLERNVFRLLTAAADKGDVEITNQLFELTIVRLGYAKPSNYLLGPKIQACLVKNDLTLALKEFENAVLNYKCTPLKNEIIERFISTEDSENLQKIVDISTTIHGEVNVLYDLACSFINCDRVKQAKKILETPGLRANNGRLNSICENLIEKGKVIQLEHFVSVSKDLFNIDRDMMYYNLIRAFAKKNLVENALGVWTTMQEEDVQPSVKTLLFLAEFLKSNNHSIPFHIPERSESTEKNNSSTVTTGETKFVEQTKALEDGNRDKVLPSKEGIRNSEQEQSGKQVSKSIDLLLKEGKLKEALQITEEALRKSIKLSEFVVRSLLKRLADDGDFEALKKIEPQIIAAKIGHLGNLLCKAYINSGKPLIALENLENNVKLLQDNFPIGGLLALLQACPQQEDRIVKMAERYHKDFNSYQPKNSLWQLYMIQGDYPKADSILNTCPELKNSLVFIDVVNHLRTQSSLELAEKLSSVVNSTNLPPKTKSIAKNQLIRILVENNQVDEALSKFKEIRKLDSLFKLEKPVLLKFESILQEQGRKSPFEITSRNKVEDASSDSSDDERTSLVVK